MFLLLLSGSIASADPDPAASSIDGVAIGLSLGTTAAGGLLVYAAIDRLHDNGWRAATGVLGGLAIAVGPTVGHTYAGRTWNPGLATRLVTVATGFVGGMMVLSCLEGCSSRATYDIGGAVFIGSAIVYGGATLYEILSAGETRRPVSHSTVTFTPLRGGGGLALGGRF